MVESARYDIIVVGGGPAGSSAALHAARRGARVLLLEKKPMPRPKLCGGWVSRKALDWLEREVPPDIVSHLFNAVELNFEGSNTRFSPSQQLGIFVDRALFDSFLVGQAEEAGATVRFEQVSDVQTAGPGRVGTAEAVYEGDGIILCTGTSGRLVSNVRPPDTSERSGACLEQRLSVEYADHLKIPPGTARLYFGDVPHGFGWVLHHGKYLLTGIGCRRTHVYYLRRAYNGFWESLGFPAGLRKPLGHLIPIGGFKRRLGRGRCLLAGDAAGFVDAFSGEGIAYAIRSGQLAADALLSDSPDPAIRVYEKLCRTDILAPLRQSLWAARLYYNMPRIYLRRFCSNPHIVRRYYAVLQGQISYRTFLWHAVLDSVIPMGKNPVKPTSRAA